MSVNREVNPASDGVAVVRGLAPGRYRLCAGNFALEFTPAIIEVRAMDSTSVDVSWREK